MIYNILLVAERCNLCCHGNSIEFIVPFIQNDFPDFISWWIIWLLLGVQSNCKKVSCYGKHKHWNRYFHIMEIQMNATYSFLASNMPSSCNDSVYVHEMDFLVWDGSGPKGGLFLAVEIGEVSGLPRYLAQHSGLNARDTEWYGRDPAMHRSPGQSYEHRVASLFLLGCYWTTRRFKRCSELGAERATTANFQVENGWNRLVSTYNVDTPTALFVDNKAMMNAYY